MSAFCGFLCRKTSALGVKQIEKMISSFGSLANHTKYVYSFKNFAIGILKKDSSNEQIVIETTRYFLFSNGRIDNSAFSNFLLEKHSVIDYQLDSGLDAILQTIRGDFILIIYDKQKDELLCIRDQLGARPFYYVESQSYFSFGSEIKAFWKLPGFSIKMDQQWIADSLSLIKSEKFRTAYDGVKRLIPGNKLIVNRQTQQIPYWFINYIEERRDLSYVSAVQIFSEKFEQSVRRRVEGCDIIGTELSGGLDSSGVAAFANKVLHSSGISLWSLSHVLSKQATGPPINDEYHYSKAIVDYLDLKHHLLCSAEDYGIIDSLKQTFVIQSGPVQQGFNIFSDNLYDTAKANGIERLLSGFGGDHGVSSKALGFFKEIRVTKSKIEYKEEFIKRSHRLGYGRSKSYLLYLVDYNFPVLRDLYHNIHKKGKVKDAKTILNSINPEFAASLDIRTRFNEKYMFPIEDTVRENQLRQIMHNHVSQRFEYSYLAAKSRNIEYAYPLWDVDLLEFYFSLPASYKFRDGVNRAIFRESIKGIVPTQISLRDDKMGITIPMVPARLLKDFDRIEKLILRCKRLNHFHYLDYNAMLTRLYTIKKGALVKNRFYQNTAAFIIALQVLLLQDMQRSGEFNSGIEI